jgi:translocator protein
MSRTGEKNNMNKWVKLASCILACQMAGIIGSAFTFQAVQTWYATLSKPWFTPPNWLFGPVWITLFTMMGISLYWIVQRDVKTVKIPLILFGAQLVANTLWNYLFFGLHNALYGLVDIVVMWALIAVTIASFYKVSRRAGAILIPYLAWVTIATLLNYYVWILNA